MISRALILAAGRGSRMGAATETQPKGLTRLAGRALIDWQRNALEEAGIGSVTAIGGYRWEKLTPHLPVRHINERWAETNMVMTLACAADTLRAEPCLVSYSDIVYHPNHARALAACAGDIALTYDHQWLELWSLRFADPMDDAETFLQKDGCLLEIGGKTRNPDEIGGQYMGLLKFTPAGWAEVERVLAAQTAAARDRLDMTALLRLLLADGMVIETVEVEGRWCEVDHQDDLDAYERRIAARTPWSHDWRWV